MLFAAPRTPATLKSLSACPAWEDERSEVGVHLLPRPLRYITKSI